MSRLLCLVALLAGVVAAPGCNCLGGGCRRPSFMEFRSCMSPSCAPAAAPCGPACGMEHGGCDTCGQASAAPCCNDGLITH